ncbi:KEOPS complex subunit Pcc1 [Halanaeroarchaeum sulfurireducens]|uniref:Rpo operon protein n=1 Tax=Halanaeroarchaeum sulfurireducens TaxID=1604004 RepID=A0A0F7P8J0_9EURY|nr:KEOPS complex subunit Pcc1 [Halanaeroarchaeum sulfurireducens]AKH97067.1 rpo operon protein [Halanaeroarchaeum sulfurireducens]ALG81468.1 rpo operon protein [Halanaeroarchaeum sulfurireducens]
MHRTTLTFSYDSVRRAAIVERSVSVEIGDIASDRTAASIDRDGSTVTVDVEASDLVGLRAGQNTWLSLVEVAEGVVDAANR